ncbi:protein [Escherichia coli]|uniref:Protein n=1 Tax=Escherichia coli TaxID=562 RepID=A0A376L8T0_ECOLX|nr:protein [Escherichia coli]
MDKERGRTAAQRTAAPALKEVAVVNPTPTPLSLEERNDLLDYGNWRMNGLRCSLDPLRREVNVTALTDDKH